MTSLAPASALPSRCRTRGAAPPLGVHCHIFSPRMSIRLEHSYSGEGSCDNLRMGNAEGRNAAHALAELAESRVGRALGTEPVRAVLRRLTRNRLGRQRGWPIVPVLGTPWQDKVSSERTGWRAWAAYLDGEQVFAADCQMCRRGGLGWVEQPCAVPEYQRCGLAAAALAACALRIRAWNGTPSAGTSAR